MRKGMKQTTTLKDTARTPFAWPGGYSVLALMDDGEVLCNACLRSEYREVYRSTRDDARDGWTFVATYVHWEGEPVTCAHCNETHESEYGGVDNA